MTASDSLHAQVAIIGAGPVGIELAVALKRLGVDYLHFEARQIGHTISWWPRNTSFFSTTERIELAGLPIPMTTQERVTGEQYLAYLRAIIEQEDLSIHTYQPVTDIQRLPDGFTLQTQTAAGPAGYTCRYLVLANGDMDFPNRLNIPGEDLPHVSHYFTDPHPYFRKKLLVVGGRNSAVEAALRCFRAGSQVTLSYRRPTFDAQAVKHWLLPDLETQIRLGSIGFLPETRPVEITPQVVVLENAAGQRLQQPADFVLLATGFAADTTLFEKAGVTLEGPPRAPVYNPQTMETNVPGLYVCGTSAAGTQSKYRLFIENSHEHVGKVVKSITGHWPDRLGTIPSRAYDLPVEDIQSN